MARIYNFKQYSLLEKEELEELDEFDTSEDDVNEDELEGQEEEEEEKSIKPDYNQNPLYYATQAIDIVTNRLVKLFSDEAEKLVQDKDASKYTNNGVELIEVDKTESPLRSSVVIKYKDQDFIYHLYITVNIVKIDDEDESTKDIKTGGVKFKKYDLDENLLGELDRKSEELSIIDRDYLDALNAELDTKYSIDDEFDIEYE